MKRVLLVDDAAFMRLMLKDIFAQNGYEVAGEAENGRRAVALYDELKPDLVIMDTTMPEMDGIEANKAILASDPEAVILMVSAMGTGYWVVRSILSGAQDFVVKPFDAETVLAKAKVVLTGKKTYSRERFGRLRFMQSDENTGLLTQAEIDHILAYGAGDPNADVASFILGSELPSVELPSVERSSSDPQPAQYPSARILTQGEIDALVEAFYGRSEPKTDVTIDLLRGILEEHRATRAAMEDLLGMVAAMAEKLNG